MESPQSESDGGGTSIEPEPDPVVRQRPNGVVRAVVQRLAGPRPKRRAAVVLGCVVVSVVAYASSMWFRIDRFPFRPTVSQSGGTTYLLIGSDSREFATSSDDRKRYGGVDETPGERADVVLALRVDDGGGQRLMTISRDLLVVNSTGGLVRLTETMLDGPQPVAQSLCRSIGLGVDHVLVLHLGGLRGMVNAIGGVQLTLEHPLRDSMSGLELPGGRVRLDGDDVLAFVASRHLEHRDARGRWSEDRVEGPNRPGRAVEVLHLLGRHLETSLLDPITMHRLAWAATGDVAMDDRVGLSDLTRLRSALERTSMAPQVSLPVTTSGSALPVDEISSGAGSVLDRFEQGTPTRGGCGSPAFPAAAR